MIAKPILFSGEMVRALLRGTKTQTRRIIKPKPPVTMRIDTCPYTDSQFALWTMTNGCTCSEAKHGFGYPSGYLWVRESMQADNVGSFSLASYKADGMTVPNANGDPLKWRWQRNTLPSIHMPREASRITLQITDIRAERLHDISETDAIAEGITMPDTETDMRWNPLQAFEHLWQSINGNWIENPWVWVVSFKVIYDNIDKVARQ